MRFPNDRMLAVIFRRCCDADSLSRLQLTMLNEEPGTPCLGGRQPADQYPILVRDAAWRWRRCRPQRRCQRRTHCGRQMCTLWIGPKDSVARIAASVLRRPAEGERCTNGNRSSDSEWAAVAQKRDGLGPLARDRPRPWPELPTASKRSSGPCKSARQAEHFARGIPTAQDRVSTDRPVPHCIAYRGALRRSSAAQFQPVHGLRCVTPGKRGAPW